MKKKILYSNEYDYKKDDYMEDTDDITLENKDISDLDCLDDYDDILDIEQIRDLEQDSPFMDEPTDIQELDKYIEDIPDMSDTSSQKLTKEERERYAEENMKLIGFVMKSLYPSQVDYEELYDVGVTGYAKALVSYNKGNGAKFSTYAYNCIRNEILFFLRKEGKHINNNISLNSILSVDKNGNNLQLEDIVSDEEKDTGLEDKILEDEQRTILLKAIDELSEKEKKIIIYRFGLDRGIKKTQKELAEETNMSQANVSKIQEKAIKKLKVILKKYM